MTNKTTFFKERFFLTANRIEVFNTIGRRRNYNSNKCSFVLRFSHAIQVHFLHDGVLLKAQASQSKRHLKLVHKLVLVNDNLIYALSYAFSNVIPYYYFFV